MRSERDLHDYIRSVTVEHGLSEPQWIALGYLSDHPNCRVADVAHAMGVLSTYMTSVLRALERKGLVDWAAGEDKRERRYRATEEGAKTLRAVNQEILSLGGWV